jgi:Fe-S-cluster containining protein
MNSVYKNKVYLQEINSYMFEMQDILLDPNLNRAYLSIVRQIQYITQSDRYKSHTKCGGIKNCSFCCHDKILMGEFEANFIKKIIETEKPYYNKERVLKQNSGEELKWTDKACPMLQDLNSDGERLCSIYEHRPLICRTHNSVMDPKECNKENEPNKTISEAKSAALDAFSFTAIMIGANSSRSNTPDLIGMHEILAKMI